MGAHMKLTISVGHMIPLVGAGARIEIFTGGSRFGSSQITRERVDNVAA